MKKVLMSLLIVCLTLCLFIGCDGSAMYSLFREEPTTKTISVIENNEEKFNFNILTTSETTWGEVKGTLTGNWTLSDDNKGRLVLKNTSTPSDVYFVTTELGEKFLTLTDKIGDTPIIYMVNLSNYTMKNGQTWFSTLVGTSGITKDKITEIHFVKKDNPNTKTLFNGEGVNVSASENGLVKGYVEKVSDTEYKIYIVGDYIFGNIDCSQMFYGFTKLTSLDLGNFDTSNVTDMSEMFMGCQKLPLLDLSSFDTSNVTDMSKMFGMCSILQSITFGDNFDTSNVDNMSGMFQSCLKLTSLDLSNFDTSKVKNMNKMFYGCSELTGLNLMSFTTSSVENMSEMFYNLPIKKLDLSNFDTSHVSNMKDMFLQCKKLEKLDLSSFDTSNVTNMSQMFSGCSGLETLNLSSFDTSNVTNMSQMFSGCSGLETLNLSSFDTSSVTDMSYMFDHCKGLTGLNLSNFDTSKVTNMSTMFYYCSELKTIEFSDNFKTSIVTNMSDMFSFCTGLTSLDLSKFDTSKVTNMSTMFLDCGKSETTIKVSSTNQSFFNQSSLLGNTTYWNSCDVNTYTYTHK